MNFSQVCDIDANPFFVVLLTSFNFYALLPLLPPLFTFCFLNCRISAGNTNQNIGLNPMQTTMIIKAVIMTYPSCWSTRVASVTTVAVWTVRYVCLFVCLSICLYVCMSICLLICWSLAALPHFQWQ